MGELLSRKAVNFHVPLKLKSPLFFFMQILFQKWARWKLFLFFPKRKREPSTFVHHWNRRRMPCIRGRGKERSWKWRWEIITLMPLCKRTKTQFTCLTPNWSCTLQNYCATFSLQSISPRISSKDSVLMSALSLDGSSLVTVFASFLFNYSDTFFFLQAQKDLELASIWTRTTRVPGMRW